MTTPPGDRPASNDRPPTEGALRILIEIEQGLEAEIERAEAEARQLVEEARRDAAAAEQDGASIAAASEALAASIEAECRAALAAISERAAAEVDFHRSIEEATLRRLARWVASRVAGGSLPP